MPSTDLQFDPEGIRSFGQQFDRQAQDAMAKSDAALARAMHISLPGMLADQQQRLAELIGSLPGQFSVLTDLSAEVRVKAIQSANSYASTEQANAAAAQTLRTEI